MTIPKITTVLEVPNPNEGRAAFVAKANAFGNNMQPLTQEMNAMASAMDLVADDVDQAKIDAELAAQAAIGASNATEWTAGSHLKGAVVWRPDGSMYLARDAVNSSTPPESDPTNWAKINEVRPVVAQPQAEDSGNTTLYWWTPQRVWQAIAKWWDGIGTVFGKSLLGAANASGARITLGLGNVDNTEDANKLVASAAKLTDARTIKIGEQSLTFDGTANITYTLSGMGLGTAAEKTVATSLADKTDSRVARVGSLGMGVKGLDLVSNHADLLKNIDYTSIFGWNNSGADYVTDKPAGTTQAGNCFTFQHPGLAHARLQLYWDRTLDAELYYRSIYDEDETEWRQIHHNSKRTQHSGAYTPSDMPAHSSSRTFDCSISNVFEPAAMTGNVSINLTNVVGGQTVQIRFQQDSNGQRNVTIPAGWKVAGGVTKGAHRVSWLIVTRSARANTWEGNWVEIPA